MDVISDPSLDVRNAGAALEASPLWRYDAILLTLGVNDALAFTSIRVWEKRLAGLLAEDGTVRHRDSTDPFDSRVRQSDGGPGRPTCGDDEPGLIRGVFRASAGEFCATFGAPPAGRGAASFAR